MTFEVDTECACCGKAIHFTATDGLSFTLGEHCADAKPMFFIPMVDFTKLKAPSIVDAF